MQQIQIQIDALIKLRIALETLRSNLIEKEQNFNSKVQGSRENGVPAEIADYFEKGYWPENERRLRNVIDSIENVGLPYINNNIAALEPLLDSGWGY